MRRSGLLANPSGMLLIYLLLLKAVSTASPYDPGTPERSIMDGEIGHRGGTLVFSQRAEPRSLNPLVASDTRSKEIIGLLSADLVHINSKTLKAEPALASSWSVSTDRLTYILHLRHGLSFSDGKPFDADDVIFTYQAYLDLEVGSPQRDLLIIEGQPIAVKKIDSYTVSFTLARPYAAAERLFDGIAILPRHLLQHVDRRKLSEIWTISTEPSQIAGMGAFRLKQYIPGQRIVLERNPYYWKVDKQGQALPYLDRLIDIFIPNQDAETLRFGVGELDVVSRLNPDDFSRLQANQKQRHFHLDDLGPGLEYDFLFLNQNAASNQSPSLSIRQSWFNLTPFRKAISSAIDREAIVRLLYHGRANSLAVPVTPANKFWLNSMIPPPEKSKRRAIELLRSSGFTQNAQGDLLDPRGNPVRFSIVANAANPQQVGMATIIQQDLKEIGIDLEIATLDTHALLSRISHTYQYDAAILALADGDADPNSELNVLPSNGASHFWRLKSDAISPQWQLEIDKLMKQQMVESAYQKRKQLYDRVQTLIWENLPLICLISPHILVGAKDDIGNFRPAFLGNYTLWNAEQLFFRKSTNTAASR
jgi:peptide/nickel transport system substrate-binding protein